MLSLAILRSTASQKRPPSYFGIKLEPKKYPGMKEDPELPYLPTDANTEKFRSAELTAETMRANKRKKSLLLATATVRRKEPADKSAKALADDDTPPAGESTSGFEKGIEPYLKRCVHPRVKREIQEKIERRKRRCELKRKRETDRDPEFKRPAEVEPIQDSFKMIRRDFLSMPYPQPGLGSGAGERIRIRPQPLKKKNARENERHVFVVPPEFASTLTENSDRLLDRVRSVVERSSTTSARSAATQPATGTGQNMFINGKKSSNLVNIKNHSILRHRLSVNSLLAMTKQKEDDLAATKEERAAILTPTSQTRGQFPHLVPKHPSRVTLTIIKSSTTAGTSIRVKNGRSLNGIRPLQQHKVKTVTSAAKAVDSSVCQNGDRFIKVEGILATNGLGKKYGKVGVTARCKGTLTETVVL